MAPNGGSGNGNHRSVATTEHLDISALEGWLWDAACVIRGATDAPKFKDFILPLVFYKRLSDVFDDESAREVENYGSKEVADEVIAADHADALKQGRKGIVRFYIPHQYAWEKIRHYSGNSLGEFVTEAMREVARLNPELQGVMDVKDFNERQAGQRTLDDDRLTALVEVVSRHRLGLDNAEPDILGRAYEYLLRKFAEGQGQSAGEFYTPKEVGWLMARLLDPRPRATVYDPTVGSAGLLLKVWLQYQRKHADEPNAYTKAPKLFGQELNPVTFALAKMNMFLHDCFDSQVMIGDTFTNPGFSSEGAGLSQFDYVVANPMWNQSYDDSFYENDPYRRFEVFPPRSSADWGWIQHMWASLKDQGRAAVVLDTGAVSRGSGSQGSNKEKEARRLFVEEDRIEGVVLLPDNLFYNTTAPGIILLMNKNKPAARKKQIILINASKFFDKERPKNVLRMNGGLQDVVDAFHNWQTIPQISKVITLDDARTSDYNLSPSQFVETGESIEHRSLAAILDDLEQAKVMREEADQELQILLTHLGLVK